MSFFLAHMEIIAVSIAATTFLGIMIIKDLFVAFLPKMMELAYCIAYYPFTRLYRKRTIPVTILEIKNRVDSPIDPNVYYSTLKQLRKFY